MSQVLKLGTSERRLRGGNLHQALRSPPPQPELVPYPYVSICRPFAGALQTALNNNAYKFLDGSCPVGSWYVDENDADGFLVKSGIIPLPIRVSVRFAAAGSYLWRHPKVLPGKLFSPDPVVEFFYQPERAKSGDYFEIGEASGKLALFERDKPLEEAETTELPFEKLVPSGFSVGSLREYFFPPTPDRSFSTIREMSLRAAHCFSQAFAECDAFLADVEFQYGVGDRGIVLLTNIWRPGSWRLWPVDEFKGLPNGDGTQISFPANLKLNVRTADSHFKRRPGWLQATVAKFPGIASKCRPSEKTKEKPPPPRVLANAE